MREKKLVKVKLLGALGRKFVRELELFIASPRDAIDLLCANFPEFVSYVRGSEERGTVYRVVTSDPLGCSEEDLEFSCGDRLVIGELDQGSGGLGKVLLGVALIGVAIAVPGGILGVSSLAIGALGASLVLGGITQMLSPQQKQPKNKDKADSFLFSNAQVSGSQGRPVPLGYGEWLITNPILISQQITVTRLAV